MSITVAPSSDSHSKANSQKPDVKSLELVSKYWWTSSRYATGSADSCMYSLVLEYGLQSDIEAAKHWQSTVVEDVEEGESEDEDEPEEDYQISKFYQMPLKVKAFTGRYGDPGIDSDTYQSSHGGIKLVVAELLNDMGFRGGGEIDKLQVIESLLGDGARELLDGCVEEEEEEERPTFRKVIEDELEEYKDPYRL
jgi:hypothetical protein